MPGTARAIYTSNGAIRQFSALGGTNADELQVEKISAITPTGSLTVALFSNLGTGDKVTLGSTTATTQVLGDLQVDGDEIVNGDITLGDTSGDTLTVNATTTFNNNVTVGSTDADDLVVTSKVASGMVFKTSTGARSISTDGTNNLTNETATSGNLILQSAGTSQLTSATGTTIGATLGGVAITPTAGDVTITAPATADLLLSSSDAGGAITMSSGAGGLSATVTGGTLELTTATSGDISVTPAGNFTITKNSETAAIVTGSIDPTTGGGVVAPTGSIYLRDAAGGGTTGEVWVKQTNATATSWTQLASATGSVSLQSAYNTGNTIETTASRPIVFESLYNGGTPSEFVVRHEGGGDNFLTTTTSSATAGTLDLGSSNVALTAGNTLTFNGTNKTVTTSTGALTLATGGGDGNIVLSPNGTGYVQPVCNVTFDSTGNAARTISLAGSGALTLNQSGTGALALTASGGTATLTGTTTALATTSNGNISLTPNGTGKIQLVAANSSGYVQVRSGHATEAAELYVLAAAPGALSASVGSIAVVGTAGAGAMYLNTSAADPGVTWSQVALTSDVTLQAAYDNQISGGANPVETSTQHFAVTANEGNSVGFVVDSSAAGEIYIDASAGSVTLGQLTDIGIDLSGHVNTGLTFAAGSEHIIQTASGSGSALTISSAYDTSGGDIKIETTGGTQTATLLFDASAGDMNFTWGASGAGHVYMTSSNGSFEVNNSSLGTANVYLRAGNDAELSTAAGDISITATGGATTISGSTGLNLGNGVNATVAINSGTSPTTITSQGASLWQNTTGDLTISTVGTGSELVLTSASTASNSVDINASGGVDIDASAGDIALNAVATYDIALTVASDAASDITFQAHGGNVTNFNSATDPSISTDFPVASRNIVGALNYLLTEAGGATAAVTSGEAYSIGDAIYISTADGKAYRCDADVETSSVFVGFAKDAATAADEARTVYVSGEVTVSTDISGLANGTAVFISTTTGAVTGTAPSGAGDTVLKVGIITNKGTGAGDGKVAIQVGTPVVL